MRKWYEPKCRDRLVLECSEGGWSSLGGKRAWRGAVLVGPH